VTGRDRLRELLDAVLDENNPRLDDMAGTAYSSRFHFARQVTRGTGETPVALRRRVMLERAAWRVSRGTSVTEAASEAGYDSVDGFGRAFARAYGVPPSMFASSGNGRGHWLPAPNGVHFHPPLSLWVRDSGEPQPGHVSAQLVQHDVDDTGHLLAVVAELADEDYRREVLPGHVVLAWDGPEPSLAAVLDRHVSSKEVWVAAVEGAELPERRVDDPATLIARHEAVAPRWLAVWRDVEERRAWNDRLVDALCDPPESFQVGSVIAHVLSYGAHRRQVARLMLRAGGHEIDDGDPITWSRRRHDR
jgi:AraC-like DNA-binding protein